MERPASPQGTSLDVDELLNLATREDPLPGWRILDPEIACDTTYYLKKEPYAPPLGNAKSKGVAYVTKFIQVNVTASRSIVEKSYGISVCLAALKEKRARVSASQQSIVQLTEDEKGVVRSILKSCHGVEAENFWAQHKKNLQSANSNPISTSPRSSAADTPLSLDNSHSLDHSAEDAVVPKSISKGNDNVVQWSTQEVQDFKANLDHFLKAHATTKNDASPTPLSSATKHKKNRGPKSILKKGPIKATSGALEKSAVSDTPNATRKRRTQWKNVPISPKTEVKWRAATRPFAEPLWSFVGLEGNEFEKAPHNEKDLEYVYREAKRAQLTKKGLCIPSQSDAKKRGDSYSLQQMPEMPMNQVRAFANLHFRKELDSLQPLITAHGEVSKSKYPLMIRCKIPRTLWNVILYFVDRCHPESAIPSKYWLEKPNCDRSPSHFELREMRF